MLVHLRDAAAALLTLQPLDDEALMILYPDIKLHMLQVMRGPAEIDVPGMGLKGLEGAHQLDEGVEDILRLDAEDVINPVGIEQVGALVIRQLVLQERSCHADGRNLAEEIHRVCHLFPLHILSAAVQDGTALLFHADDAVFSILLQLFCGWWIRQR